MNTMKKKIFVIGAGGRTGSMFCEELKEAGDVYGVGLDREIDMIEGKNILMKKCESKVGKEKETVLDVATIRSREFTALAEDLEPDYIFVATKNPVTKVVAEYYKNFKNKKKVPALILSQNGLSAAIDAKNGIKEAFGSDADRAQIIRMSLFNPIEANMENGKFTVSYKLPIRLCFGVFAGNSDAKDLREIFSNAGILAEEVISSQVRNMEYTKLFMNLIGMPSAANGRSVKDAFSDLDMFGLEVNALKEYLGLVSKADGKIINFEYYSTPLGLFAWLIKVAPIGLLAPFAGQLAKVVSKGRGDKPKDLDEIDYYTGEVTKLARQMGLRAPINDKVLAAGIATLARQKSAR